MRFVITLGLILSSFAWGASTTQTSDPRPVTQDQFKESIRVMKRMLNRIDRIEKSGVKPSAGGAGADGEVDLNALDSSVGAPPIGTGAHGGSHAKVGNGAQPNWKVFFDLDLVNRPGTTSALTFANYHALLFFEMLPDSDLQFAFDVNPSPRFYELDYQMTPKVQLRAGKIWIPFDDMSPHNIFGGRVNTSTLAVSDARFLPDIWSELGVGAKFSLIDKTSLSLDAHLYVVNGFGSGGVDPTNGVTGNYPKFSDSTVSTVDNNRDKAIGTRVHALLGSKLGFGASYYRGRWNDQEKPQARGLSIIGLDSQLRLGPSEIRAGLAAMNIDIDADLKGRSSFKRAGLYLEYGQKFGLDQRWKFLVRGGKVQLDDRVIDITDQQIVGGTLLYKPGLIEFSAHHSRDLKENPSKLTRSYSVLRIVIAL